MPIKLADNTQRIEDEALNAYASIEKNASEGIPTTELYFPKHIASDIKERLIEILDKENVNHNFLVITKRPNEYTGQMNYFTSETIGDERRYKIKIS